MFVTYYAKPGEQPGFVVLGEPVYLFSGRKRPENIDIILLRNSILTIQKQLFPMRPYCEACKK